MARRQAKKRRPFQLPASRADRPEILSGVFKRTHHRHPPLRRHQNGNTHSSDYDEIKTLARPPTPTTPAGCGTAALTTTRGGGHFSGRLTAPMVFAGAIMKLWLRGQGIEIGSHILRLGPIEDIPFDLAHPPVEEFPAIAARTLPVWSEEAREQMQAGHFKGPGELTSVGGVMQVAVTGVPAESAPPTKASRGSSPATSSRSTAVKGIEFGLGFGFGSAYGHEVNDEMRMEDGKPVSTTN